MGVLLWHTYPMAETNPHWVLARRPPAGWPSDGDFAWREGPVPSPRPGQVLTRTIYLSLDPYQWGRRRSGVEKPGEVCHGRTVSLVLESRRDDFAPGDFLFNTNGWATYGLSGDGVDTFGYMFPRRLDPAVAPISTAVGVMGMLGLTAWSGMRVQCDPQPGETVVVSAASGGVGQVAAQIARLAGCRVVGIAGSAEKCAWVTEELGLDACVSRRSDDLAGALRTACPDGIDVYFENVGGAVFEAVLPHLNRGSRISLCGLISQYGNERGDAFAEWQAAGAAVFERQRVKVHKLFVGNFVADHQDRFLGTMGEWLRDGLIRYREHVYEGLERAPEAFADMLAGRNFGKTLVRAAPDPTRGD